MSPAKFLCGHCNHKPFATRRAWTQHLQSSAGCASLTNARCTCNNGVSTAHKHMPSAIVRGLHKAPESANKAQFECHSFRRSAAAARFGSAKEDPSDDEFGNLTLEDDANEDNNEPLFPGEAATETNDEAMDDGELSDMEVMLKDWIEHERRASGFAPFGQRHRHAIELLPLLRTTKASPDTCESMMTWHVKCTGEIHSHEKASDSPNFVSQDTLLELLKKRYNRDKGHGLVTIICCYGVRLQALTA